MTTQTGSGSLRKAITLRHAVAMYVSSVVGPGILVLPGLAAHIAGPASLIAWGVLSLASYAFAYTFAMLSARSPLSGGIYAFAMEGFGRTTATVTGWLFVLWFVTGGPAATLIAASYVAYAFPMSRDAVFLTAGVIILTGFTVNAGGIVMSNRVQVIVVDAILALLVLAVASSVWSVRAEGFVPFVPHGWMPVGTAAALIFWSYLGYENVSNVAEEFHDPERDFRRSILLSVCIIGVLYVATAVVTIGTESYLAGGSVAPFAAMFSRIFGSHGAAGTAILALIITLGTVNVYTAGMSRVIMAVARDGGLPRIFARVSPRTGAPTASLVLLSGLSAAMLIVYYFLAVDLQTALLIPSGAAVVVYVIGSAAGIRLLPDRGWRRSLPWISLAMSVAVLPFVGMLAWVAVLTGAAAMAYGWWNGRRGEAAGV